MIPQMKNPHEFRLSSGIIIFWSDCNFRSNKVDVSNIRSNIQSNPTIKGLSVLRLINLILACEIYKSYPKRNFSVR